MKNRIKNVAVAIGCAALATVTAAAQSFTNLHEFNKGVATDASGPTAQLVLSGNTLYGTTQYGGSEDQGTVFKVNTDGTGFTNLYNFINGNDGANPFAGLILSGSTLYGTAQHGGSSGNGTIFAINTDGTGFTNLHSFSAFIDGTNSDGTDPQGGLILSGNTLYGTARNGGSAYNGTVFKMNTNGTGFATLHNFTYYFSDGGFPESALVISSNTLYGEAYDGPPSGSGGGTVFAVDTDNGAGFVVLHTFTNGIDGVGLVGGLILSSNVLFGTAYAGGLWGQGTVFALNTDGTDFTILHTFSAPTNGINTDGVQPYAGLILSGDTLYGTAESGGAAGNGTVFALNTDGSDFTILYTFSATTNGLNTDGALPYGGLILPGDVLYGTASGGGTQEGSGTLFALDLTPSLGIAPAGNEVVLSWPAWAPNFVLQSATNLVAPVGWTNVIAAPVVVNNQNTITNPMSGTQMFYRLSH